MTRTSIGTVTARVVGLFLLGVFLQWAGRPEVTTQQGTVYSEIAQMMGAGPPTDTVAKLPAQQ